MYFLPVSLFCVCLCVCASLCVIIHTKGGFALLKNLGMEDQSLVTFLPLEC